MKTPKSNLELANNNGTADLSPPRELGALLARERHQKIDELGENAAVEQRLKIDLEHCYALLQNNLKNEAWNIARETLDEALRAEQWTQAVEACDVMFQSEQDKAVKALAQGIWLGVTFPVDPELSVAMLQHLIDESPDRSDGAAVAAATACYLVDLRGQGKQRDELLFFTQQMIGEVARRHSQVEEQEVFEFWIQQLQLDDPGKFLPRLGKVLDILVDGEWWFERDELRAKIPE